jgi:hypothetical protein
MNSVTPEEKRADSMFVLKHTYPATPVMNARNITFNALNPANDIQQRSFGFHDIPGINNFEPIRMYTKATKIPTNGFELRGKPFYEIANIIKAYYEEQQYTVIVPEHIASIKISKQMTGGHMNYFDIDVNPTDEIDDDGYNVFVIVLNFNKKNKKINAYDVLFEINGLLMKEEMPPLVEATEEETNVVYRLSPDDDIPNFNIDLEFMNTNNINLDTINIPLLQQLILQLNAQNPL